MSETKVFNLENLVAKIDDFSPENPGHEAMIELAKESMLIIAAALNATQFEASQSLRTQLVDLLQTVLTQLVNSNFQIPLTNERIVAIGLLIEQLDDIKNLPAVMRNLMKIIISEQQNEPDLYKIKLSIADCLVEIDNASVFEATKEFDALLLAEGQKRIKASGKSSVIRLIGVDPKSTPAGPVDSLLLPEIPVLSAPIKPDKSRPEAATLRPSPPYTPPYRQRLIIPASETTGLPPVRERIQANPSPTDLRLVKSDIGLSAPPLSFKLKRPDLPDTPLSLFSRAERILQNPEGYSITDIRRLIHFWKAERRSINISETQTHSSYGIYQNSDGQLQAYRFSVLTDIEQPNKLVDLSLEYLGEVYADRMNIDLDILASATAITQARYEAGEFRFTHREFNQAPLVIPLGSEITLGQDVLRRCYSPNYIEILSIWPSSDQAVDTLNPTIIVQEDTKQLTPRVMCRFTSNGCDEVITTNIDSAPHTFSFTADDTPYYGATLSLEDGRLLIHNMNDIPLRVIINHQGIAD